MDITRPLLSSIVQRRRNLNISRDTNFSSTMPNVTTSTIGSNFSSYVNLTDIGQINILNTNSGITIQDQVIIGAGAVVGILAIVAVVLRILMPMFRKTKKKREKPTYDQYDGDRKSSGSLPPYRLAPSISNSQSSSASSISQYDISDSSSNMTRSTYCSNDSRLKAFGNLHGSTLSLPVYVPESNCGSCNDLEIEEDKVSRRLNDTLLKSLEPLQMGHTYRQRWDAEFDPGQITPTGSLSSLNHPSESSGSRNSLEPMIDVRRQIKPPSYSVSLQSSNLFTVEPRPRYESRLPTKL